MRWRGRGPNERDHIVSTDVPRGEFMKRRFRLAYFMAFLKVQDPGAIAAIPVEPVTTPAN